MLRKCQSPTTHSRPPLIYGGTESSVGRTEGEVERGAAAFMVGVCGARAESTLRSAGLAVVNAAKSIAAEANVRMMPGDVTPLMSCFVPAVLVRALAE